LAYRKDPSFFAVGQALGVHHQTVQRCVERALAYGPMAALDDRPRPGKEPTITAEARTWLVSPARGKAKDLGYPHELWTTRLLARHARRAWTRRSVHALVKDRHRSREFIEFLKLLDAAYPALTAIKLILDNYSAHISKETKA
jgi:transposase